MNSFELTKCPECSAQVNDPLQTICYECGCLFILYLYNKKKKSLEDETKKAKQEKPKNYSKINDRLNSELKHSWSGKNVYLEKLDNRKRILLLKKDNGTINKEQIFEIDHIEEQKNKINFGRTDNSQIFSPGLLKAVSSAAKQFDKDSPMKSIGAFLSSLVEELNDDDKNKTPENIKKIKEDEEKKRTEDFTIEEENNKYEDEVVRHCEKRKTELAIKFGKGEISHEDFIRLVDAAEHKKKEDLLKLRLR